ncbi:hypothetical protein [Amycolatopsis sp. FDAARGOS 1241]|uniref:hypothetical protein n=1 Tax=Amycolatopsis sp. FDAARGOS 1241 TaxID=2778070 RepID=UPI001952271C|nr:hypothetical protein [Amycolatopsis sp. FDAARGOS 1241]QRP43380.1 hypothetical protein I6J71_28680 [Amycolatopsis sp. FDAARGOS 1241]
MRYAERRTALAEALGDDGVAADARDGLTLWIPVPDETRTLVTLAAHGVSAGAGTRCFTTRPATRTSGSRPGSSPTTRPPWWTWRA